MTRLSLTLRRFLKPLVAPLAIVAAFALVYSTMPTTNVKAQKETTINETRSQESTTAVFTNSTSISVTGGAANNAVPYPSAIAVSGLTGTIASTPGSVKVTINNFSHTFPDDLGIVLVAPNGDALLLQDGAGDDPDMVGVTYTFSDDGATQLPDLTAWAAGTYKPTGHYVNDSFPAPGPLTAYQHPGPAGSNTGTFTGTFGGDAPNGTWNLFVRDFVTGDAGTISGGWTLEITTGGGGVTPQHVVDFNGDGKTDFTVVRNTGGGAGGQITWFTLLNGGAVSGTAWGIATDFFVPEDYDGDSKTDVAVYRPGAATVAGFYILQSATNTFRFEAFGQTGDDPTVVGDYDGDNKADVAVYRGGAAAGQGSTWYYRGSLNNPGGNVTFVPWGQNGDFPAPGDYDGDGKNDFMVQRPESGSGHFYLLTATLTQSNFFFGTSSDVIVPGDYDGDQKTDVVVVRGVAGAINWYVRPSGGGSAYQATFGASATDFPTQGDYDGDGKTDLAIWRPSATAGQTVFWYFASGTSTANSIQWGQNGDYPVANYNSH